MSINASNSAYVVDKKLAHTYTMWCHNQNAATPNANISGADTAISNSSRAKHVNTTAWYKVTSFSTINQYWACIKALLDRPRMVSNGMIFIMKDDIHPDWANTDNITGGRISWKLEKPEAASCWENLCCLFVSGEFESIFGQYETRGISISPKKASNIIKLWLGNVVSDEVVSGITLPDKCIFKDKLMIFRSNSESAAINTANNHGKYHRVGYHSARVSRNNSVSSDATGIDTSGPTIGSTAHSTISERPKIMRKSVLAKVETHLTS